MNTYLVAWAGDQPGAQFVRALGAADACLRLDFVPAYLLESATGTWSGYDAWTKEGLAVIEVRLDNELSIDLTETIALLADAKGGLSRGQARKSHRLRPRLHHRAGQRGDQPRRPGAPPEGPPRPASSPRSPGPGCAASSGNGGA